MKGILQKMSRSFLNAQKYLFSDSNSPLGSSQTSPRLILDCLLLIIKAMHIHSITGRSLHFGKVLLATSYNILFTSIVISIFTQDEQTEKLEEEVDQKIQTPLLEEIDKINQDRMYPHIQLRRFDRRTHNLDHPTNPV